MTKATTENKIRYLILLLFMPVFLNGLNSVLTDFLGFSTTGLVTLAITGIAALYGWILIAQGMQVKSLFLFISIMALFAINFAIFSYSREYFLDVSMLLIYIFYLPISVLLIKDISDWSTFIDASKPYCYLTTGISLFVILFTNYSANLNYMEFSYAVLPFIMLGYITMRNNPKFLSVASFLAICLCILVFGARATIFYTALFVLYCEFFVYKTNVLRNLAFLLAGIIIVAVYLLFQDAIAQWASDIARETGSYFLKKLTSGEIFVSSGRDDIGNKIASALSEMGLKIYGFFGDRYACNIMYAHNIVYEIYLSFGWILGSVIIAVSSFRVLAFYIKNRSSDLTIIFGVAMLGIFARYIMSGSFVIEGKFYICMAMMASMMAVCKKESRNIPRKKLSK